MKSLRLAPALAALVGLSQLTCHQVLLTAPPGSTMTCFVNPTFIAANGDVAVVSAVIFDATGSPVADGTVVQFFTNLGRIQEQGKTNDGVVRVNFFSDSRSGKASIRAFSGGEGSGGTGTTTTTTVRAAPLAGSSLGVTAFSSSSSSAAFAALANCSDLTVDIGSARPRRLTLTADPPRLTDSRTSQIVANVFDEFGNPVVNVPIFFESVNPSLGFMESGGAPRYTDNNGRAVDVFRTRLARDIGSIQAEVRAFAPDPAITDTVRLYIN